MNPIKTLKGWWQKQTGEEETPLDGDTPVYLVSMVFHLCLIFALALFSVGVATDPNAVVFDAEPIQEQPEELELPEEFYFSEQAAEDIGANSFEGAEMAFSQAELVSEVSEIPSPIETEFEVEDANIQINNMIEVATGLHYSENLPVKGAAGQGETGAEGAIDRITHEILNSLEERQTMVVWLFDQSASLLRQREDIRNRFDKVYEELGVIEAAGNEAFAKHTDKPLLTSIVAFGQTVTMRTKKPTDNIAEIKEAVANIQRDDSGVEKVFSAVYMAADKFKSFRVPNDANGEPDRNVLLIVFTDEKGEDVEGLDTTVKICRRYEMPVFVVGVPAPFGREQTQVKWVDPDPEYDQSPQWAPVSQGPESFLPERVKLRFSDLPQDDPVIDSGFGPFALTRLAYETGGVYFAVHPNRNVNRSVSRRETAAFSAHMEKFFDPNIMRKYRPDYVSKDEYMRRVQRNKARQALIIAAQRSGLSTESMKSPQLRFARTDEATFVNALTDAQRAAAKLTPKMNALFETLKVGEADREGETELRWQAGYDLAMGRVLAWKVRIESYNHMLAAAKRGLKAKDEKTNVWVLEPSNDPIEVNSQLKKMQEKAFMYLERVVELHPDTPWSELAQRELDAKIGWKWGEDYTPPPPPRQPGMGNGNANPAPAAGPVMLKKPPMKRPPPKL
ncbi:MAG: VWA domain-containing protein [bacterium]|nr:VWA domain-containing protein [bacterium]